MLHDDVQKRIALIRKSKEEQRKLFDAGHIDDGLIVGDQLMTDLLELLFHLYEQRITRLELQVAELRAARHPP